MEKPELTNSFLKAAEKINSARKILLSTHILPDGDGLGGVCALSLYLDSLGKEHACFCADPWPAHYSFLPNIQKFTSAKNWNFSDFDLVIVMDCGALSRTGLTDELVTKAPGQYIIEIDHHPKIDDYADLEIRLPEKSSASEILYHFFSDNNLDITPDIANCILAGIITDTGNWLFGSVGEETIKISSALILSGAALPKIMRKTAHNKGLAAMKIWGRILENLRFSEKYGVAYSVLTYEEITELKKTYGETGAFDAASDILNNAEGIKAALFLREEEPGKIKGSLRTKDSKVDVSRLATFLGGGGHPKAAAFRFPGHIEKNETGWKII